MPKGNSFGLGFCARLESSGIETFSRKPSQNLMQHKNVMTFLHKHAKTPFKEKRPWMLNSYFTMLVSNYHARIKLVDRTEQTKTPVL